MQTQNPFDLITARLDELAGKVDTILKQQGMPREEWVSTDQAAQMLGVHRITLWNWRKKDILQPVRFGNTMRYKTSDIEALAAKSKK